MRGEPTARSGYRSDRRVGAAADSTPSRTPAWERWPDELWTLTELDALRLDQGLLSKVPSALGRLTTLRVLELAFRFQFFAPGLGELANLRELIIRGPHARTRREGTRVIVQLPVHGIAQS